MDATPSSPSPFHLQPASTQPCEGEALASAWEPANPHDEALLIATVPKLHGKSTPMYAGGKPPAQPWCGAKLSPCTACCCARQHTLTLSPTQPMTLTPSSPLL